MAKSLAAKSRTEKGKTASANQQAVTQEIIPGKFNNHDWNAIVEQDESDDFCEGIVEEVVQSAIDIIFEAYLKKQLIPYTVAQAKDALVQIVEWRFLSRDEGEDMSVEGWAEDEEPEASVTDCWAQGSVPRQILPSSVSSTPVGSIKEEDEEAAGGEEQQQREEQSRAATRQSNKDMREPEAEEQHQQQPPTDTEQPQQDADVNSTRFEDTSPGRHKPIAQHTGGARPKQRKQPTRHRPSHLRPGRGEDEGAEEGDDSDEMGDSNVDVAALQMPASCQSILKLQAGRPPGQRDIYYDEAGNVVSMTRIHADRLPTHRVQTMYHVVDPAVEAAQTQLEAMRTGRYQVSHGTARKHKQRDQPQQEPALISQRSTNRTQSSKELINTASAPLPPPLLESMNIAPGVIVKEGDRVKKGPKQNSRRTELITTAGRRGLRPLTIRTNLPEATVAQLLQNSTPIIRPLSASTPPPIPPIIPHPPSHAKPSPASSSSVSAH